MQKFEMVILKKKIPSQDRSMDRRRFLMREIIKLVCRDRPIKRMWRINACVPDDCSYALLAKERTPPVCLETNVVLVPEESVIFSFNQIYIKKY